MIVKLSIVLVLMVAIGQRCLAGSGIDVMSGPGGAIPAAGTGGGGQLTMPPLAMPPTPFSSTTTGVTHIPAGFQWLTLHGLSHTWIGDLQIVLFAPDGRGYNMLYRPGFVSSGFGSSGDFLGGTYTFRAPAFGDPPIPTSGDVPPGTYSQTFGSWSSGTLNIWNTPLSMILGAQQGQWTLRIYDWAGGDTGFLESWSAQFIWLPAPAVAPLLLALTFGSLPRRR